MNHLRDKYIFLLLTIAVFINGCKQGTQPLNSYKQKSQEQVLAIRNVNIIPMTPENKIIQEATIVIRGNKIISINQGIPDSAKIIDGSGKWLIPGLIDMHVHTPTDGHFNTNYPTRAAAIFTNTQDIMTPYVANGVTSIFDLNAMAGHFGQRNEILRGDVIGPRMALAAMINGGDGSGRIANTPADGRQAVRMLKAEGYEFIKVYSQLNEDTYKAIVDEAYKQGMKVAGHIPNAFKGKIDQAFVPHLGLVAHAEEFFKQTEGQAAPDLEYLARLAKENGTWVSPTLVIIVSAAAQSRSLDGLKLLAGFPYVHPLLQSKWLSSNNYNKNANPESIARLERMIDFNKRLLKALKAAGVPILAGTDAGSSGVVWGFSLHDELRLLVEAGLSPEEALLAATRSAATWLQLEDKVGSIEVGKYADLVLLDANPLTDIQNTQKISAVMVNGRWLPKSQIKEMLTELFNRHAALKEKYDWSKRKDY